MPTNIVDAGNTPAPTTNNAPFIFVNHQMVHNPNYVAPGAAPAAAGTPAATPPPTGAATGATTPANTGTTSTTLGGTGGTAQINAGTGTGGWQQGILGVNNLPAGSPSPTNISVSPDILNSMNNYTDAAYQQAASRLDPQWQQAQAQFDQQMQSQGIQPGSAAYNAAAQQFGQQRNDAYGSARNAAMQQGLQAQGQAFQEGFAGSNLANELARAQMGAGASIYGNEIGANASMFDAATSAAAQRAAASSGANASMHNSNNNYSLGLGQLGLAQNAQNFGQAQTGFQDYMAMLGYGQDQDIYNNSIPGQEIGNMSAMGGMLGFVPNNQTTPVDVTGAYGINQAGQNAAYQGDVANANGQNQMYGTMASAAIGAAVML